MHTNTPTIRTFIAVELPPSVRAMLDTIQGELRESMGRAAGAVKWVRPEGTHLTLQFLGDVRTDQITAITQGIERGCEGIAPFTLNVDRLGVFPNPKRPRVIWVGLDGNKEDIERLNNLQSAISAQMKTLGFQPDKAFKPHLTLGRVRDTVSSGELASISEIFTYPQEQPMFETQFAAHSVSLMRSDLQPGGAVYTELAHVELAKEA